MIYRVAVTSRVTNARILAVRANSIAWVYSPRITSPSTLDAKYTLMRPNGKLHKQKHDKSVTMMDSPKKLLSLWISAVRGAFPSCPILIMKSSGDHLSNIFWVIAID